MRLGNANIFSVTNGAGTGATVTIKARIVELREGARIFAGTGSPGDAGSIIVEADRLSLSNDTSPFFSNLGTNTFRSGRGNPGDIILNVGTLELLTGGVLKTSTAAPSTGGDVLITADRVIISGDGTVFAIDEFPPFVPVPGNLTGIVTSGVGIASGDAGNITITAGSIEIGGGAVIASTVEGVGSGGTITLNSGVLTITEAARLDASTTGPGAGGSIFITSDGTGVLDGPGSRLLTESFSTAPDAGTAGDITVAAAALSLTNGAQISTESALADGGNVDLGLVTLLLLRDSQITTSVGTGTGGGGNIVIDPVFVVLDGGTIQANAFGGPGGNISIVAENFLASPDSLVEASSALGIAGTVAGKEIKSHAQHADDQRRIAESRPPAKFSAHGTGNPPHQKHGAAGKSTQDTHSHPPVPPGPPLGDHANGGAPTRRVDKPGDSQRYGNGDGAGAEAGDDIEQGGENRAQSHPQTQAVGFRQAAMDQVTQAKSP